MIHLGLELQRLSKRLLGLRKTTQCVEPRRPCREMARHTQQSPGAGRPSVHDPSTLNIEHDQLGGIHVRDVERVGRRSVYR